MLTQLVMKNMTYPHVRHTWLSWVLHWVEVQHEDITMCSLQVGVHTKTTPAAQRAETFEEQGFKNTFVKFSMKNLIISLLKWQLNSIITIFPKNTLILP